MDRAGGYEEHAFIADLYDQVVPYREREDVAFFVEESQKSGGPVLEVGCGTGRILIPTARAGIEMVGLDLSPHMLEVCRQRVRREPADVQSRIQLVRADMRGFSLAQSFKLVTTPFRTFQHLTTMEDQLACLECVHRHLVENGRLILDIFNPSLAALVRDNLRKGIRRRTGVCYTGWAADNASPQDCVQGLLQPNNSQRISLLCDTRRRSRGTSGARVFAALLVSFRGRAPVGPLWI